jgi:enoyl-CoA hydratase/carnithine racemase
MGLVDEVVPDDGLADRVQAYAEGLAAKPARALAAIRRTVTLGGGMSFEDGLALELEEVAALAGTADFEEGVAAFLEKRPPKWDD